MSAKKRVGTDHTGAEHTGAFRRGLNPPVRSRSQTRSGRSKP